MHMPGRHVWLCDGATFRYCLLPPAAVVHDQLLSAILKCDSTQDSDALLNSSSRPDSRRKGRDSACCGSLAAATVAHH